MINSVEATKNDKSYNDKKSAGGGYTTRERIGYIDALKGFAILCVVLGHIALGYLQSNAIPNAKDIFHSIYQLTYAFHMPLFMAISGYLYYTAYFDEAGCPKRKKLNLQVLNLVAIYLLFSIGYGIFKLIFGRFANNDIAVKDVLLIVIRPIAVYWYLYVLIALYLIFSIHGLLNRNKWMLLGFVALLSVASNFVDYRCLFELKRMIYYALFFYLGISYKKYGKWIFDNLILALPLLGVSVVLLVGFWKEDIATVPVINSIVAFGIVLVVWYMFQHINQLSECHLLKFIGKHSLEIYVIHSVVITACRAIIPKTGISNVWFIVISIFIISTAIPILFSVLCKKLNIHGLFFKPVTYIANLKKQN